MSSELPIEVTLDEAAPDREPMLARLMQLYAYDFSELTGCDVREDGCFPGGTPLHSCWSEPWRSAFVIRADARIAGFCILDERSRLTGDPSVSDVAEFFVLRRHRRRGVGLLAARLAFARSRCWEVRQTAANASATAFWRQAIAAYTGGKFTETFVDDARWRGPVQCFGCVT